MDKYKVKSILMILPMIVIFISIIAIATTSFIEAVVIVGTVIIILCAAFSAAYGVSRFYK